MGSPSLSAAAFRPSGSVKWMHCAGSPSMESGLADVQSEWAESGQRQHRFAELVLMIKTRGVWWMQTREWQDVLSPEYVKLLNSLSKADQESVMGYVDWVVSMLGPDDQLLVEQPVWHGNAIGAPGAMGTFDFVILRADGLSFLVGDRKFPWGKPVYASGTPDAEDGDEGGDGPMRGHPPMMLYALGILETYGGWMIDTSRLERIDFAIYQESPGRADNASLWSCTPQYLESFRGMAANAVRRAKQAHLETVATLPSGKPAFDSYADMWVSKWLTPGKTQCKYCKARATCPALRGLALSSVAGTEVALAGELEPQFGDWELRLAELDDAKLEEVYERLPLVKDWAKAVAWQMLDRMQSGAEMARHKLVQGRQGNRKWTDEQAVSDTAESLALEALFEKKLLSPAQAEAQAKKGRVPGPLWKSLQDFIERAPGKPTVVEIHDKRVEIEKAPQDDAPADFFVTAE